MLQHGEKKDKKMSLLPIHSRLSSQAVGLEEVEPCQVWDVVQGAHCPTCPSNDPWDQGEIRIETSPGFGGQVGPVHSARSGDLHFKHKTYFLLLQILTWWSSPISAITLVGKKDDEEIVEGNAVWPWGSQRAPQEVQDTSPVALVVQVKQHLSYPLICVGWRY